MIDIETLSIHELIELRDACNRRILELYPTRRRTLSEQLHLLEEIKSTLRDQGKNWRSLERWQWLDGEIRFWLNPTDQTNYQLGWYSIDELIAWTQNRGPIIRPVDFDDEDNPQEQSNRHTDYSKVRITWLPDKSE